MVYIFTHGIDMRKGAAEVQATNDAIASLNPT